MSTTVKTGWLHDKNGDKFAPKTLTSQVQTSDGTLLEDKLQIDLGSVNDAISEMGSLAKQYTDLALESSKMFTNDAVAQKTQVQIITWGADD